MQTMFRRKLSAWMLAAATAALLASAPAAAGGRGYGHGYYGHPGYGHGYGYGKHRGYDRHYDHHRKHRRGRSNDGAYLLGGIVIGSLLTHALTAPAYAAPPPRSVRYYEAAPARRLFRDIDGNCFERRDDGYGRELLIELPYRECAW